MSNLPDKRGGTTFNKARRYEPDWETKHVKMY